MLISHRAVIACPSQQVWEATTNIDQWSDWTPTVQTARRLDTQRFGIGSQAIIKQPMQSRKVWTVTELEHGRFFAWETSGKALSMQATHQVDNHGGGTISTLTVKLMGPAAMISAIFLGPLIWLALMQENRGLKRWCETARRPEPTTKTHPLRPPSAQTIKIPEKANEG